MSKHQPRPDAPYTDIFGADCMLSGISIQECLRHLGAAFVYAVCVPPNDILWVIDTLRQLTMGSMFAPQFNVHPDTDLPPGEWYIGIEGTNKWVGSRGIA